MQQTCLQWSLCTSLFRALGRLRNVSVAIQAVLSPQGASVQRVRIYGPMYSNLVFLFCYVGCWKAPQPGGELHRHRCSQEGSWRWMSCRQSNGPEAGSTLPPNAPRPAVRSGYFASLQWSLSSSHPERGAGPTPSSNQCSVIHSTCCLALKPPTGPVSHAGKARQATQARSYVQSSSHLGPYLGCSYVQNSLTCLCLGYMHRVALTCLRPQLQPI